MYVAMLWLLSAGGGRAEDRSDISTVWKIYLYLYYRLVDLFMATVSTVKLNRQADQYIWRRVVRPGLMLAGWAGGGVRYAERNGR